MAEGNDEKRPKSNAGRKSTYKPEYCEALIEYFSVEPYREVWKKVTTKAGDVIEVPTEVASDFPSLAGFAIKLGVHRGTLWDWAQEHEDFAEAYKMAREYQENWLLVNGLKGTVNPPGFIFVSKAILHMRDKDKDEAPQADEPKLINPPGPSKSDIKERIKLVKGSK